MAESTNTSSRDMTSGHKTFAFLLNSIKMSDTLRAKMWMAIPVKFAFVS